MLENLRHRYEHIVLVLPINFQIHHHPADGTKQEYRKNAARVGNFVSNLQPNGGIRCLRQSHQPGRRSKVHALFPWNDNLQPFHEA